MFQERTSWETWHKSKMKLFFYDIEKKNRDDFFIKNFVKRLIYTLKFISNFNHCKRNLWSVNGRILPITCSTAPQIDLYFRETQCPSLNSQNGRKWSIALRVSTITSYPLPRWNSDKEQKNNSTMRENFNRVSWD